MIVLLNNGSIYDKTNEDLFDTPLAQPAQCPMEEFNKIMNFLEMAKIGNQATFKILCGIMTLEII